MASFKTEEIKLTAPAERVYDKLSNLEHLGDLLKNVPTESIPQDKKEIFDNIHITADTLTIPGGPVGEIKLRMKERVAPKFIKLVGEGTPVPMSLEMRIVADTAATCLANVEINLEIPALLKPMIKGPLQKITEQFGSVLKSIPFN